MVAIIAFRKAHVPRQLRRQPYSKGFVGNMLLAIDVGNTQTVIGVYDGENLVHMWRLGTIKTNTADELRLKALSLLKAEDIPEEGVHGSALASVVPALTDAWVDALEQMLGEVRWCVRRKRPDRFSRPITRILPRSAPTALPMPLR